MKYMIYPNLSKGKCGYEFWLDQQCCKLVFWMWFLQVEFQMNCIVVICTDMNFYIKNKQGHSKDINGRGDGGCLCKVICAQLISSENNSLSKKINLALRNNIPN